MRRNDPQRRHLFRNSPKPSGGGYRSANVVFYRGKFPLPGQAPSSPTVTNYQSLKPNSSVIVKETLKFGKNQPRSIVKFVPHSEGQRRQSEESTLSSTSEDEGDQLAGESRRLMEPEDSAEQYLPSPSHYYREADTEAEGATSPTNVGVTYMDVPKGGTSSTSPSRQGSYYGQSRSHPRMGRRFTLNPLIFAKEERDARRQSLAQLKLSYYPKNATPDTYDAGLGFIGWFLVCLAYVLLLATFPISVCFCIKIVQEFERAVIFRLGRLIGGGARGPGLFLIIPCIESYTKVDLRTVSFSVPPQEILTRDSVTVSVDAVVYYRVCNATVSVANVENAHHSTRLLAQTTLRNMLGTRNLAEILSDRDNLANAMQTLLDEATESWGIKVERVEIKDVRLPVQLQRSMAAEAEATREARAKVIAAEGEQKASRSLQEAATVIATSPAAIQLRYLQTLSSIAAEKNSTIVFPLPMELIRQYFG
ncbi:SPFH domain / band 7 family domain-containing protein [Ditylenchus destructor]|uniref:SPFH domain / band 7 family domain-containing protein n=1 Tax=Ditylenchus destructor TaxID=166010 RepID=A0AAD4N5R7_9BILA|nr:SPFH domain / band 7 family domain-containing protein [Ditylenchus destructor]